MVIPTQGRNPISEIREILMRIRISVIMTKTTEQEEAIMAREILMASMKTATPILMRPLIFLAPMMIMATTGIPTGIIPDNRKDTDKDLMVTREAIKV